MTLAHAQAIDTAPRKTGYPHLLGPFSIGRVPLRNRIVFQPHFTALGTLQGMPSDDLVAYHEERARGGVGLIVMESMAVHPTGKMSRRFIDAYDEAVVPHLAKVADAAHRHGAKIFGQLTHAGHTSLENPPPIMWAPTQMPEPSSHHSTKAMDDDDIRAVIDGFAASARNLIAAGLDGVEIKIAHDGSVAFVRFALLQPPKRRIRRLLRKPDASVLRGSLGDQAGRRGGRSDRRADVRERVHLLRLRYRIWSADGGGTGGDRQCRLLQRRRRVLLELLDGDPSGCCRPLRLPADQQRPEARRWSPGHRLRPYFATFGRGSPRRRGSRPRRHGATVDCRSRDGQQAGCRSRRPGAALHRLQRRLHLSGRPGEGRALCPQSWRRPRADE